jgi:DMSO/TMAO reductase YedYZ molybdopterin-dependent catalytic subunit
MKNKALLFRLFFLFISLFIIVWIGTQRDVKQVPLPLDDVEVTEYQGEQLSAVNSFRENSIKGPQYVDADTYSLEVTGLLNTAGSYSYAELLDRQSYQKVVTLFCVEGWSARILWEGILLSDLIAEANPDPSANTVIFHAADGYTTSLPLDYIVNNDILMAYKMNNITLPPQRGFPFQLVAQDKWGYKWIRWITKVELSNDPEYLGYWESRGYSNTADQDEHFF